ncbi:hypothetical protein [Sphaerisporangium sp. NPDC051011]|uniref:hypothetical protein n=1 Tax=Sphaerisporangium sp. NPDC051011 TaxID=3155792 RepID=UPI0033FBA4EC
MTFDVEALQRLPDRNPSSRTQIEPPATTTLITCETYVTGVATNRALKAARGGAGHAAYVPARRGFTRPARPARP